MRAYRWWPAVQDTPLEVDDPVSLARHFVEVGIVAAALCIPAVTRATGLTARIILPIIGVHLAWTMAVMFVIRPSSRVTPVRFHLSLGGSIAINTAIVIAFPALGSDPRSPLWMIAVMYACFNGSTQSMEPSLGVLLVHVSMPLLAIPILLARGADPGWSVAGPLLCATISAVGYNALAQSSASMREIRQANEAALERLRARLADDEDVRLARELHDSMGSSLAIVGLYGDLIVRHADRPDQLRSVATMIRDAANEGATELASLLGALTPDETDLDTMVATLDATARRAALTSGVVIDVRIVHGGDRHVSGSARLVLVRVFQESLHNALSHGQPGHVTVQFAADAESVALEITDDGRGFVVSETPSGRGLSGMRARVAQLAGSLTIDSAPGAGARIALTVPRLEAGT